MLSLENVCVRFGQKQVLKNVSFSLRPNRLTVLVGANGAGKSTLLGCVNQRLPYMGTIRQGGRNLAEVPPRERAKSIAILPQTLPAPRITGREMVCLGRNPHLDFTGRLRDDDKAAVEAALGAADALNLAQRYVDTLSGGEKQRIALAMILAQNTPIVLLDEPTAHMDLHYEASFLELLKKLKQNKTILVILHDLNLAAAYADDLIVLDRGEVVFCGTREECLRREILERTFRLRRFLVRDGDRARIFYAPDGEQAP